MEWVENPEVGIRTRLVDPEKEGGYRDEEKKLDKVKQHFNNVLLLFIIDLMGYWAEVVRDSTNTQKIYRDMRCLVLDSLFLGVFFF